MGWGKAQVVFTDANILINLVHIQRVDLLACFQDLRFVVPMPVRREIVQPKHRQIIEASEVAAHFALEDLTNLGELQLFAELRSVMGDGEAACLAMATERGAWIATLDKKRRFRREARRLVGEARILNLAGLIVIAIQHGILTVSEADGYKAVLEKHRFRWKFRTFQELL